MVRRLGAALALLALLAPRAHAVFHADEITALETERLFDSEYFLDLRSFSYPLDWELFWDISTRGRGGAYRVNAASLDRTDLFVDQDVSLRKPLTDWLAFRYSLDHQGDKDLDYLFQWLDLEFGPFAGFTFALFGEPKFDKEDADVGLRLGYRPSDVWNVWASVNFVDFNFNGRGKNGEAYDRKPLTYAAGVDAPLRLGRLSARLELDMPLQRRTPAAGRVYGYRRTRAAATWLLPPAAAGGWHWLIGCAYEFKREHQVLNPDPSNASEDFHRAVHVLRGAGIREFTDVDTLEVGAEVFTRGGDSEFVHGPAANLAHKRWEAQPYARWRRHINDWNLAEAAVFLGFGEKNRRFAGAPASTTLERVVEAKLGLGWDFIFGGAGRIGLYPTFDLDDFPTFDGGNIRAMFLFN